MLDSDEAELDQLPCTERSHFQRTAQTKPSLVVSSSFSPAAYIGAYDLPREPPYVPSACRMLFQSSRLCPSWAGAGGTSERTL